MNWNLLVALLTFAAIAAYTPGPNNTLLLASGMKFGYRRSLPLVFGVCIGFPAMIGLVGLGLGQVFERFPESHVVLKFLGAGYMLWLAYKIATSGTAGEKDADALPMNFWQASAFQWVNPKAWFIALAAPAAYTLPESYYLGVAVVVLAFMVMGFTSASIWAMFGVALRQLLSDARYYRWINYGLALVLVISLVPMLRQ